MFIRESDVLGAGSLSTQRRRCFPIIDGLAIIAPRISIRIVPFAYAKYGLTIVFTLFKSCICRYGTSTRNRHL